MTLQRYVLAVLLLACAEAASGQQVNGRVVEASNRRGVHGVEVTLVDAQGGQRAQAVTDTGGFFTLRAPGTGQYRVIVIHPGYTRDEREIRVPAGSVRLTAFVLNAEAVVLDAIMARGERPELERTTAATFSRTGQTIAGARMAQLERVRATPIAAVLEFPGIRVREFPGAGRTRLCIESIRGITGLVAAQKGVWSCNWIAIVLDGMVVPDPDLLFRTLNLQHFESIEYLPPGGAGFRYGLEAGAQGALVLWTRGFGPHVSPDRNPR